MNTELQSMPFAGEFGDLFEKNGVSVQFSFSDLRAVTYDETTRRCTDEQYVLTVSRTRTGLLAHAACSGEKSAFYAACDLKKRLETGALSPVRETCAPRFPVRGYIEGFYGKPWSRRARLSIMRAAAMNRMNTVYYAPKDDPFHRDRWRELYPPAELARLKELCAAARRYYMAFCWCAAPGLSIRYADPAELDALLAKTKQLYRIGVRSFGLLLDDIPDTLKHEEDRAVYGELVNAHTDLIYRYRDALVSIDPALKLTVCPTLYHGRGDEYYIAKLGSRIPPEVSVFWTGRDICSRELTADDARRFLESARRRPLYWDNYPVNDEAMKNEMHLSPVVNRDPELWRCAQGVVFNCMEYAECSKIPLISGADYLWQGERYDPEASFEAAVLQTVGPDRAADFMLFADHLYTSCLMDENSRRLSALFTVFEATRAAGDADGAAEIAENYLAALSRCSAFLHGDYPICRELRRWTEKFDLAREILPLIFSARLNGAPPPKAYDRLIRKYEADPTRFIDPHLFWEAVNGRFA